ncbi:glycosyltransferase family 4 protein [Microbulbifer sp. SAOS-129_SWC]|uniref:glycosyltransferase family 4 protein n=1 Tax=Microbulbifer sp. SAOS-129_SWC TaxID=3145235 RepID=UPI0032166EBB
MIHTICHLIASRDHGRLEKHVADLSRWQAHHSGAQVAVIAHPRFQNTLDPAVQFLALNTDHSRHHANLVWRLANQIRTGAFQVVHGHGSKSAQLLAAVQPYTDSLQVITRHNVRHPRDKLASAFDARIAVSRAAVANSRLNWDIIPSGIDMLPVAAQPRAINRTPVIAAPARLVKTAHMDTVIGAMAALPDARLQVVGDGPERSRLEALSRQLQLQQRVEFTGEISAAQQRTLLCSADLMVSCAQTDGASYRVIEALLNRCPVVSSRHGDTDDYLPAPYLLDTATPESLVQRLNTALSDRPRLQREFAPVFDRAAGELTLERMGSNTWQVYLALAAQYPSAVMPASRSPRTAPEFAPPSPRD